ncbi:MAG: recombinase family protein [Clostridiales Family XIII bacterium]|jgi:DNA invertase Pin-like site-specific DNA recombinase|nr:recombinase family protein [Clostridiales Family XIII bacterium]
MDSQENKARSIRLITPQERDDSLLRVAAYCRVSSPSEDQLHSYAVQVNYYTKFIGENPDWELADIYADEGITGTRVDKRDDFNRLLTDCRNGKIDRLIVKSVARFARNTKECLEYARLLKDYGVSIYFENENIDTALMSNELLLTVSGMMAQEESVSISKNMRWSYQRRMEQGEFSGCRAPLGYNLSAGELIVNEDEAKLVRRVFGLYLSGEGMQAIATAFNNEGVEKRYGKENWHKDSIRYILTNEKYIGDTLCQKCFTTDTIPFRKQKNIGQKSQYYVENSHPAIIDREMFGAVQALLNAKSNNNRPNGGSVLNRKIICPDCGHYFRLNVVDGKRHWICSERASGRKDCKAIYIAEDSIAAAFFIMASKLAESRKYVLSPLISDLARIQLRTSGVHTKIYELDRQVADLSSQNHAIAILYGKGILEAADYTSQNASINQKISGLRKERNILIHEDENERTISEIQELNEILETNEVNFNDSMWVIFQQIVQAIVPVSNTVIKFRLLGGLELEEDV